MKFGLIKNSLLVFFDRREEEKHRLIFWAWIFLIYLLGLIFFGILFDWRQTPINYHDWATLNLPRFQVIKESLTQRVLPLHISNTRISHDLTDRFLVIPDTVITPQMALLLFMDSDTFALFDVIIHYTIATIGLLYFKRKFNLSLFVYAMLFFLFNSNGHIQAHYAVGHANWGAYFLFPFFVLLLLEFVQGNVGWWWVTKIALLSLYVLLTGGQHHFTWMMLFLSLLGLAQLKQLKWVFAAIVASGFLGAIRLLPPILIVSDVTSRSVFQFRAGYPGLAELFNAFISIRPIDHNLSVSNIPTGYWEYDYFIGILGFALLSFGIWSWLCDPIKPFHKLLVPIIIITALSMGFLYEYTLFNLPIFASERVISRMISLPVTLLLMISAIYWQKTYEKAASNTTTYLFAGLGLLLLLNDLLTHTRLWSVKKASEFFSTNPIQFNENLIQNRADPEYIQIILAAIVLSIVTAMVLTGLVLYEKKKINPKPKNKV
ncbi:MAG: hypothetical protein L6461_20910 [Anaerolineae bacterium]|nr:hypothetical protein [Anaerolineae bacterium]